MKNNARTVSIFIIGLSLLFGQDGFALSLSDYLGSVQKQSLNFKASDEQAEASALKSREADLFFSPKLFANARVGHDAKLSMTSTIIYDDLKMQNYSLGVSQEFRFGLQTKLSYAVDRTEIVGGVLPAGTPSTFWTAAPTLEVTMPLWGNGFGRTTKATEEVTRQQNLADQLNAESQKQTFLVGAEAAYWRLASAQEIVSVQERAVKQAQEILNYLKRKSSMNLAEGADVLQAKASVEATTYQLTLAQNQAKAARRQFNTYLNQDAETAVPILDTLNYDQIQQAQIPATRPGDRIDVKAAQAQTLLAKSSSILVSERNKPTVDVFGSYAMNGQDEKLNEAMEQAGRAKRDTAFVGVRLNVPLNLSALADARAGAAKAELAADYSLQYRTFAQTQDWTNLVQQFSEAKENLRLTANIVNAQKAKLQNERTRLRQGRTTTYQVLLFEQDFSQSEVSHVQAAAQILGLQSQIKLYQASNLEGGK